MQFVGVWDGLMELWVDGMEWRILLSRLSSTQFRAARLRAWEVVSSVYDRSFCWCLLRGEGMRSYGVMRGNKGAGERMV